MSEVPAGPSGTNPPASGEGERKDSVAYETHQKLLGEKKRAAEKAAQLEQELEAFKAKERERENQELERQKNYEQLLKNREEELKSATQKLTQIDTERTQARKLDAFLKTLGGELDQRYWSLIDIDQIALDPATKSVDEMTVAKAVETFRKTYPETIKTPGSPNPMPSGAPAGNPQGKIPYQEWVALKHNDPKKWEAVREGRVQLPK